MAFTQRTALIHCPSLRRSAAAADAFQHPIHVRLACVFVRGGVGWHVGCARPTAADRGSCDRAVGVARTYGRQACDTFFAMLSIMRFVSGSLSFFDYASRFGTVVPSLRIIDKHAIAFLAAALPLQLLLLERYVSAIFGGVIRFGSQDVEPHTRALASLRGKRSRSVHGRPLSSMVAD
jgi:hypothetical protein